MLKYESLVKPLAERERHCLEAEEELHRQREVTKAFCRGEEQKLAEPELGAVAL